MKKFFLFLISIFSCFLFASCGKADDPKEEETTEDLKPVVEKELIEGTMMQEIVSEGVLLTAPSTILKDKVEFVFAYFGLTEDKPLTDKESPVYKYGQMDVDNFSYLLKTSPSIKPEDVKPYYTLKKYFHLKGLERTNGSLTELKQESTIPQTYYANLNTNTLIPSVTFKTYAYLDYYTSNKFQTLVSTFGELEEATKTELTLPTIFALKDNDPKTAISTFDVNRYLNLFNIEDRLTKYVLTRNKEQALSNFNDLDLSDLEIFNEQGITAYYSRENNILAVRLFSQIKYDINNHLVPINAEYIDLSSMNNEVLFADSYSFNSLFKDSTASVIDLTSNKPANLTDMSHLFSSCLNLKTIKGFETFDTSNVTSMSYLFYNTPSLEAVNLSNLNTNSLTDASHLFHDTGLKNIDLTDFNTRTITDFKYMFANLNAENLTLPTFNFSSVRDIRGMFSGVTNLKELNLNNADFSEIEYFDSFFKDTEVNELAFGNITFSNTADFTDLFTNAKIDHLLLNAYSYSYFLPLFSYFTEYLNLNLKVNILTLNSFKVDLTPSDTTSFRHGYFKQLTGAIKPATNFEVKDLGASSNATLKSFFDSYDATLYNFDLTDLSTWDVSNVSDMSYLFYGFNTNLSALGLALNWDLKNTSNLDRFIDTSNFTSLSLESKSKSNPTSALGAFSAQDLETLELKNIDFTKAPLTVTTIFTKLKSITASNLPIDYLANITDLIYNTNKTHIEKLVVDSVTDNDPNDLPISLNNNFNFSNIKEFQLDHLNIPRIKSYNSLFKGFTYGKGAKISAKYWVLNNPDLDLTLMFEGVNLFYDLGLGFTVSDNATMTNMFKNATLSDVDRFPLDLDSWRSTTTYDAKINVKTYTNMFDGVNAGTHERASLSLNQFNFDTSTPQTIANSMNVSSFNFNDTTDSNLKLFAPVLKTLIDNGTLKRFSFNDLTFETTDLSLFTTLPFSTILKLETNNLSFTNLRFHGANTSLANLFKGVQCLHPDINTIDFMNVNNIDNMFAGAVTDQPLRLNLRQNVSANALFQNAIINGDITQVTDPASKKFKFTSIDSMFEGVLALRPLHLDTFNIDNPTSAKFVFKDFRFNDGDNPTYSIVLKENRILNITSWDFKNYKDDQTVLQDFFLRSETNNISHFIYNKADVYSFIALSSSLCDLSYRVSTLKNSLHYDFKYLYLHDTSELDGIQKYLFDGFEFPTLNLSNLDTKGEDVYLNHLFFIKHPVLEYRLNLNPTDFSTWHLGVLSFMYIFHSVLFLPDIVDLSGLDVSKVEFYSYSFAYTNFHTLITNNWDMTITSNVVAMFYDSRSFSNWIFTTNFTPPATTLVGDDCWQYCDYRGDKPDNFPDYPPLSL